MKYSLVLTSRSLTRVRCSSISTLLTRLRLSRCASGQDSFGVTEVTASCDNCRHQNAGLGEHYRISLTVRSVTERLVDALVTTADPANP